MDKKIEQELNIYLSNVSVMYTKLHNLHWNISGPRFKTIHEYLETLYDGFSDVYDEIAELIKMQNGVPFASIRKYIETSTIKEIESIDYSEKEVLTICLADLNEFKKHVESTRLIAVEEDNYAVIAMLEDQLANYNKTIWFLESMLK
ncbi:MAG: DNA starvation/stationary phase protection protein [bacterium]